MAYINTGYQSWTILEGIYLDDSSLDGLIMPNIAQISPQAIVPYTANITFNYPADITPTGGTNGDIWYNSVSDTLYKNFTGTWVLLTDRVTNDYYIAPVINTTSCPV